MTSRHRYGPHREQDAPNAVTVLPPGTTQGGRPYPAPEVRPIPAELREQRRAINARARYLALIDEVIDEALDGPDVVRGRILEREFWPCCCGRWHPSEGLCPDGGWIV